MQESRVHHIVIQDHKLEESVVEESVDEKPVEDDKSFENFIIDKFDFSRKEYKLLERNDEEEKSQTNLLIGISGIKIYQLSLGIECEWRKEISSKGFFWARESEMQHIIRYAESKNAKIYLILGVGGTPTAPKSLYIVPIKYHADRTISAKYLTEFEVKPFNTNGSFHYDGEKLYLK